MQYGRLIISQVYCAQFAVWIPIFKDKTSRSSSFQRHEDLRKSYGHNLKNLELEIVEVVLFWPLL